MTRLLWDQVGERIYETGIDRGVLYYDWGGAVPWNGLRSVEEDFSSEVSSPVYFDGLKTVDVQTGGDFSATLRAFTFPDGFLEFDGFEVMAPGMFVDQQRPRTFNLSYRTYVADDVDGIDHGYRIHILYNLLAVPDIDAHESLTKTPSTRDFVWKLVSVPEEIDGYRPTSHIMLDSRRFNPYQWAEIEILLYGDDTHTAELPPLAELSITLLAWDAIIITDHGDGTWSATGPDEYFTMVTPTQFEIREADATYSDADTYTVTDEE